MTTEDWSGDGYMKLINKVIKGMILETPYTLHGSVKNFDDEWHGKMTIFCDDPMSDSHAQTLRLNLQKICGIPTQVTQVIVPDPDSDMHFVYGPGNHLEKAKVERTQ